MKFTEWPRLALATALLVIFIFTGFVICLIGAIAFTTSSILRSRWSSQDRAKAVSQPSAKPTPSANAVMLELQRKLAKVEQVKGDDILERVKLRSTDPCFAEAESYLASVFEPRFDDCVRILNTYPALTIAQKGLLMNSQLERLLREAIDAVERNKTTPGIDLLTDLKASPYTKSI